jgi:hypothetical protein
LDGVRALGTLWRLRLKSDTDLFGNGHDWTYYRERQVELAQQHPLLPRPDTVSKR